MDNRRESGADLLSVFHGLPSEAGTPLLRLDMDMHGCVATAVRCAGHSLAECGAVAVSGIDRGEGFNPVW